jgi:hypothetical protein
VKAGFPLSALVGRQLGPGTLKGYKEPAIRKLLSSFPQRVVLVGDSGERDPEVYALIRREFPERVAAIFIDDVGRSGEPGRFEDMVLFARPADAAKAAAAWGLVRTECVDRAFPPAPVEPEPPGTSGAPEWRARSPQGPSARVVGGKWGAPDPSPHRGNSRPCGGPRGATKAPHGRERVV